MKGVEVVFVEVGRIIFDLRIVYRVFEVFGFLGLFRVDFRRVVISSVGFFYFLVLMVRVAFWSFWYRYLVFFRRIFGWFSVVIFSFE